jgi:glycosyltransferase involved in cell wall biosynthesis
LKNTRSRIIILTRRNPILEYGGDIRRINVYINSLKEDFFVDVVCLGKVTSTNRYGNVEVSQVSFSKLWAFLNVIKSIFLFRPIQSMILTNPKYIARVKNLCEQNNYAFGIVHLIRFAEVSKEIKKFDWYLEMTDAMSKSLIKGRMDLFSLMGIVRLYEKQVLLKEELNALQQFKKVCLVSEVDKEFFSAIAPQLSSRMTVIPNTVSRICSPTFKCRRLYSLGFIGRLDSYVNQQTLLYVLEYILNDIPNSAYRLKVIGANCPLWLSKKLGEIPGVKLVANAISIEIEAAEFKVGLCPIEHSNGIQNKIMDYFFGGCSAVTSPSSRIPFLEVDSELGQLIKAPQAHRPSEYIECIKNCLALSEEQRSADAQIAQSLFQKYFSEDSVAKQIRSFCGI